jgi:hypothetical protein
VERESSVVDSGPFLVVEKKEFGHCTMKNVHYRDGLSFHQFPTKINWTKTVPFEMIR